MNTLIICRLPSVDIAVSITPSGINNVGETYSLECSATVNGSTDETNFTWLSPENSEVPSEMISTAANTSTLIFSPLSTSLAGTYTCRVTLENVTLSMTFNVTVEGKSFTFVEGSLNV